MGYVGFITLAGLCRGLNGTWSCSGVLCAGTDTYKFAMCLPLLLATWLHTLYSSRSSDAYMRQ